MFKILQKFLPENHQFAIDFLFAGSVIELPRIPAYYPKIVIIRVRMQNFCI